MIIIIYYYYTTRASSWAHTHRKTNKHTKLGDQEAHHSPHKPTFVTGRLRDGSLTCHNLQMASRAQESHRGPPGTSREHLETQVPPTQNAFAIASTPKIHHWQGCDTSGWHSSEAPVSPVKFHALHFSGQPPQQDDSPTSRRIRSHLSNLSTQPQILNSKSPTNNLGDSPAECAEQLN